MLARTSADTLSGSDRVRTPATKTFNAESDMATHQPLFLGCRNVDSLMQMASDITDLTDFGDPAQLIHIGGETLLTTFDHHLFEMADIAVLQQGPCVMSAMRKRPSASSSARRIGNTW